MSSDRGDLCQLRSTRRGVKRDLGCFSRVYWRELDQDLRLVNHLAGSSTSKGTDPHVRVRLCIADAAAAAAAWQHREQPVRRTRRILVTCSQNKRASYSGERQ